MKSPAKKQNGLVAILDAIGAAAYSDREIEEFLQSRQSVLRLLNEKIEGEAPGIIGGAVHVFTFNDTIVIAYGTGSAPPTFRQINSFFRILRKFLVDSLAKHIMFRGSLAIGTFYVDDDTNTVMGQAVTDAAAWYDKADWLGIQATPRATLVIGGWLASGQPEARYLMLDYDVPLKTGKSIRVKAVNWPRMFFVERTKLCPNGEEPKEKLLQLLAEHAVPLGTEQKYFNTVAFFDVGVKVGAPKLRGHQPAKPRAPRT